MIGIDSDDVQAEVRRAAERASRAPSTSGKAATQSPASEPGSQRLPDLRDPRFSIERETLKLVLQAPMAIGRTTADIGANDFTHPIYRGVWDLVAAAGGTVAGADDAGWAARLRDAADDPAVSSAISALAVEPLMKAPGRCLRRALRLQAARAHRPAPHRRHQVQAAAHQPGRRRPPTTTGCSASSPRSSSTAARCATGSRRRQ